MMDTLVWIDSNGDEWEWPYQPSGIEGRGAPPSVIDADPWAGDGAIYLSHRYGVREIFIPLTLGIPICGGAVVDEATLRSNAQDWTRAIAGSRGGGTLRIESLAGGSREIACVYAGGMEWVERSTRRFMMGVALRAFDPFWTDVEDSSLSWTTGETTAFFPLPRTTTFIPISPGVILADETINNTGDDTAWPIWTLTGPTYGQVEMTNVTTEEVLSGDFDLGPGETLTIDTRPGKKSVTHSDGTNQFSRLDPGSVLWGFPRGLSDITVHLASADTATELSAVYRRRWLTA